MLLRLQTPPVKLFSWCQNSNRQLNQNCHSNSKLARKSQGYPDKNNNQGDAMTGSRTQRITWPQRCAVLLFMLLFSFSSSQAKDRLQQAAQPGSRATQALLLDIIDTGEALISVGEQGIILHSGDQGLNWQPAQVPVSVLLTAVHFATPALGWAVGHDGIVLHSTDGGQSWQRRLDANQINQLRRVQLEQALNSRASDSDEAQQEILAYALDDAITAEEDGASSPLLDVLFLDQHTGFILGAYGLLLKTTDGGQSWRSMGHLTDNPDGLHLNSLLALPTAITPDKPLLLIAGEAGLLLVSDNLGESWQTLDSPYEGSFFAQAWQNGIWLLGLRGNLFRSADANAARQAQWQQQPLPRRATLTGAIKHQNRLWLLGQGGLVLSQQDDHFMELDSHSRRAFSAGVLQRNAQGEQLVLVGEGGISYIPLDQTPPSDSYAGATP